MHSPAELLNLTSEAAVLVSAGRTVAANAAARVLLGDGCIGRTAAELFGPAAAGMQSGCLAQLQLGGRPCVVRAARSEGDLLFFLRPLEERPSLLNQPFLYALRSSLMNMELAADRLRLQAEDYGAEPMLETLRSITRGQYRIQRLLQNASMILSAAEGGQAGAPRLFSLRELCSGLLEAVQPLLPEIRFSFRADSPTLIHADPEQIKTLVANLLSNAILHAEGRTRVSLSLLESGKSVVLAVDDDGCGIPPEQLYEVFDRYRHSFDLSQMSAGPGLGLTAARMIALQHGGTLLLESRPGRGTTLRVSLQRGSEQATMGAADRSVAFHSRDLLLGLADCLPLDCFSERYLD